MTVPQAMNAIGVASRPRAMHSMADLRRRLAQLWHRFVHHRAHRRYVREIDDHVRHGIMVGGWFQQHKYLGEYFARSFSKRERRELILAHWRFVANGARASALRAVLEPGLVLWELRTDEHVSSVRLRTSQFAPMEGEWQLQYVSDGQSIGTLTFLFGSPRGLDEHGPACLIGGVQGGKDCREAIRIAAKANGEIAAASMLAIAARAVAEAFGVTAVFGISSREQVFTLYSGAGMKADYDGLWQAEGATRTIGGFHALTWDRTERDLGDISRSHRRRTRRKRERKAEIHAAMVAAVVARLTGTA